MGDAGLQARGHGQEAANLLVIVKRLRKHEGRPDAGLCAGERAVFDEPLEILWRDTGDGLGFSIEKNGFADNGGIAREPIFPKAVAENDDVVVASLAIFRREAGAEKGIDSEHGKEIRGDGLDYDFLGVAISGEIVSHVGDV